MVSESLLNEIREYIKAHSTKEIECEVFNEFRALSNEIGSFERRPIADRSIDFSKIEETLKHKDDKFSTALLKHIDASGMTDAEVYNKAQLNKAHFNKIKNNPDYNVQKETVFALGLALKLGIWDFDDLLKKAGYTFNNSSDFDLIIKCCVLNKIYDVIEVNQILEAFQQKLLGAGIR